MCSVSVWRGSFRKAHGFADRHGVVRECGKAKAGSRKAPIDIGVDVARYGDDSSVLYPVFDKKKSDSYEMRHHNRTTEISGYVVMMVKRYAAECYEASIHVKIDCDGLGVVFDNLD